MEPKIAGPSPVDESYERAVRCHHIARWWEHAAQGRCTVEEAVEATAALIAAIDRLVAL